MKVIETTKLKPCIRCGSQQTKTLLIENTDHACVCCPDCWEEVGCERVANESNDSLVDRVIEKWNTRPTKLPKTLIEEFNRQLIRNLYSGCCEMMDIFVDNEVIRGAIHQYYSRFCREIDFAKFVRGF